MMTREDKWNLRMIELAQLVSTWSKDPSTKCGAVIYRPDMTIASVGYNGFPRNCSDDHLLYDDKEEKYGRILHAEVNAILSSKEPLDGYSIATYPAAYAPSCDRCTACIIQAGIKTVVHIHDDMSDFSIRWQESMQRSLEMYDEAGVEVLSYDPEKLFKEKVGEELEKSNNNIISMSIKKIFTNGNT